MLKLSLFHTVLRGWPCRIRARLQLVYNLILVVILNVILFRWFWTQILTPKRHHLKNPPTTALSHLLLGVVETACEQEPLQASEGELKKHVPTLGVSTQAWSCLINIRHLCHALLLYCTKTSYVPLNEVKTTRKHANIPFQTPLRTKNSKTDEKSQERQHRTTRLSRHWVQPGRQPGRQRCRRHCRQSWLQRCIQLPWRLKKVL